MQGNVLIAFRDESLGGTSRSAVTAGGLWSSLGYACTFTSDLPVAGARLAAIEAHGAFLPADELPPLDDVDVVHLHQAAWAASSRHLFDLLVARCPDRGPAPRLLVNNIFGSWMPELRQWPGELVMTTLGEWSARQMLGESAWLARRRGVGVLPNAQDDAFFREPSREERAAARRSLGLPDQPLVIRLGSPLMEKWSTSYVTLARRLQERGSGLLAVGAPEELSDQLRDLSSVTLAEPTSDEERVRDLYWAADVFALDANRGESFGNVILESLLCGTPVVYRGRPYRDNTPFEFASLPGFHYADGESAWIGAVLAAVQRPGSAGAEPPARSDLHGAAAARYGIDSVSRQLAAVLDSSADPVRSEIVSEFATALTWRDRCRIRVRHNPAVGALRRRRRASW